MKLRVAVYVFSDFGVHAPILYAYRRAIVSSLILARRSSTSPQSLLAHFGRGGQATRKNQQERCGYRPVLLETLCRPNLLPQHVISPTDAGISRIGKDVQCGAPELCGKLTGLMPVKF